MTIFSIGEAALKVHSEGGVLSEPGIGMFASTALTITFDLKTPTWNITVPNSQEVASLVLLENNSARIIDSRRRRLCHILFFSLCSPPLLCLGITADECG